MNPDSQQPDTPRVPRDWCPECQPEVDPLKECVVIAYCIWHPVDLKGLDDPLYKGRFGASSINLGDRETDPDTQRAWAKFLREKKA